MYWNIFLYISIPIIILGIEKLTGEAKSPSDITKLKELDLFTILSHLSWIIIYVKGTHWIFIRHGAKFLSQHPELLLKPYFNTDRKISVRMIKIAWISLMVLAVLSLTDFCFTDKYCDAVTKKRVEI